MEQEKENKMKDKEIKKESIPAAEPEQITPVVEDKKEEKAGIAYIFTSANNTMVHITDLAGNTLSRVSGGMVTKHSRLKADPTVAMFVAKKASERAKDLGINALYIRMRAKTGSIGFGPGVHSAVRSLSKEGFRIINILDTSRVARGGPKKKGGRRGRRV